MSLGILTSHMRALKTLRISDLPYDKVLGFVASKIDDDDADYSHIKQRKTKTQLILLSACVCGIEFCYAAETAFVSPTLLQIGVPVYYMTLIWCLSPLLGFFLVPLLGSISDRCRSRLGRRRPFILLLSAGIIVGLVLVPNGKKIGVMLGDVFPEPYKLQSESIEVTVQPEINEPYREPQTRSGNIVYNPWMRNMSQILSLEDTSTEEASTENWLVTTIHAITEYSHGYSIFFTVIGVVLLDFSCDACQSPCRAYMLDVTVPEDHSVGLSTFTVLAGLGGALGYVMGGINWGGTSIGVTMGSHVRAVFSMVLVLYLVFLALTMTSIREVPLDKLGISKEDLQKKKKSVDGSKYRKFTNEDDDDDTTDTTANQIIKTEHQKDYGSQKETYVSESQSREFHTNVMQMTPIEHGPELSNGYHSAGDHYHTGGDPYSHPPTEKNQAELSNNTTAISMADQKPPSGCPENYLHEGLPFAAEVTLKTYLMSIVHMPRSLWILCLTNLFCWMSLVCYSLYFTDFVGQAVYGGDPSAPEGTDQHRLYEEGVRMGSLGMSLYSLSCSFYSLSIEKLVSRFGARNVYIFSQLVYTVGSFVLACWRHRAAVILLSPAAGIMYATLFTMPYLLVAHYHSNDTFEEVVEGQTKPRQVRGLGTDIALVSSMVFFAQFLLSLCMGSIVHAAGTTTAVIVSATVLSCCGAITATQVMYLDL